MRRWPSGEAPVPKTGYAGSNPARRTKIWPGGGIGRHATLKM